MTAPRPDPLAGWRAARAARVAGSVATVATAGNAVATPVKPQKTETVATVSTVASENKQGCNAREAGNAWGLSDAERAAALARLEAAEPVAVAPAPPEPLTPPALPWWQMDYGAERGRAFAEAKATRGACPICAGRRWWRRAGTDDAPTCATCHPPDHLAPEAVRMVTT